MAASDGAIRTDLDTVALIAGTASARLAAGAAIVGIVLLIDASAVAQGKAAVAVDGTDASITTRRAIGCPLANIAAGAAVGGAGAQIQALAIAQGAAVGAGAESALTGGAAGADVATAAAVVIVVLLIDTNAVAQAKARVAAKDALSAGTTGCAIGWSRTGMTAGAAVVDIATGADTGAAAVGGTGSAREAAGAIDADRRS